jgi:hypothetical protein
MNADDLSGLADFLQAQRNRILLAWRNAIAKDPTLTSSDPLPKADLYDHIPTLLTIFETHLRHGARCRRGSWTSALETRL